MATWLGGGPGQTAQRSCSLQDPAVRSGIGEGGGAFTLEAIQCPQITRLMSLMGQSRRFNDVRATSGFIPEGRPSSQGAASLKRARSRHREYATPDFT